MSKPLVFSCFVEKIIYHDEGTDYSILLVSSDFLENNETVMGNIPSVRTGDYLSCSGNWVESKDRGLQFKAETISYSLPLDLKNLEKYLCGGLFAGIGKSHASSLVKTFGPDTFEILGNDPKKISKVANINISLAMNLCDMWREQKGIADVTLFFSKNGITGSKILKIYEKYGPESVSLVKQNPYIMVNDISGIGFKTVDDFASKIGFDKESPFRFHCGLKYSLEYISSHGDCAIIEKKLIEYAKKILRVSDAALIQYLPEFIKDKSIVVENNDEAVFYYLTKILNAENELAKNICRIINCRTVLFLEKHSNVLQHVQKKTGKILDDAQSDAVKKAMSNKITIVSGGPGVGKTTTVNTLLKYCDYYGLSVLMCAPTGKAAKRMEEATGVESKTIHRLLEYDVLSGAFKKNSFNKLKADIIIVDEFSMMDVVLANDLLNAIPSSSRLIIVGDINQLSSVGAGNVLNDLIVSGVIPTAFLTNIHRQSEGSKIISNAHRVNSGLMPQNTKSESLSDFYFINAHNNEDIKQKLEHVVFDRIPARFGFDPKSDIQILTPSNKGELGTSFLNKMIQQKIGGNSNKKFNKFGTQYRVGDKVIQTVNNYTKEVFNGETGVITKIDDIKNIVTVDFDDVVVNYDFKDLGEISLAYVMTIHKSQGSEYPVVVVLVPNEYLFMLERNLLYTAMTRGRKLVIIIGETAAIQKAVDNNNVKKRNTFLAEKIIKEYAKEKKDTPKTTIPDSYNNKYVANIQYSGAI